VGAPLFTFEFSVEQASNISAGIFARGKYGGKFYTFIIRENGGFKLD